ncbi:TetR/AcrR family transcriptional regulator [uncultured Pseudokineococcus sp.]|uniref:TetR/AcrR family transcriptional regulator n=1 Tax=uncultured Pseudokineococcus sp. TaxID=1642928 RepID=UPI0026261304|nr:TetR/AcrR family transcriptional regulator [uncultured Pseudokineococcus sp.]
MPEDRDDAPLARPAHLRPDALANRRRVLAAAARQLAGPEGLAMNALAREAGVGVGTVYRHFPTRQVLLEALGAEGLEALVVAAERAAEDERPGGALADLLRQGLRRQLTDPALAAVLAEPDATCADTAALLDRLRVGLDAVLARERAAGLARDDVDADDVRRLLCGLARAVGAGPGRASPSARYVDVVLQGLRRPPAP